MAILAFKVQADYDKVIKLREEITKLETQLKSFNSNVTPQAVTALENRLASTKNEMMGLVETAAIAGAEMEQGFKKKIFDASQTVNKFSEDIILQKGKIQGLKNELADLKDKYRIANTSGGDTSGLQTQIRETSAILREQKGELFNLSQEQANARLSVKKLKDEYELMKEEAGETKTSTASLKNELMGMGAKIFAGIGIKEFIGQMIQVRGQFQQADTAIETLLGSKEKADALMAQVREYAKISPLEFSDVTAATQMMLGFNIEAEKVPEFLSALGDVSMGNTQKFNSLTLAFSQMSAAGKLMGQDLNQMINAGFNPLQQISQTTGKSIAQLKDEMSKGAVSAEMVQQAFIDATSAGGRFYQMSEKGSETINGQISMMQDALATAFNEMGQASEGLIMSGIQGTTVLIENYETVGKIIAGLIATYGVYRAAVLANIVLTQSWATAAKTDAIAKGIQTVAAKSLTVATGALNAVMMANPYVLAATALAGVAAALWAANDGMTATERAQKRYNERVEKAREEQAKFNEEIQKAVNIATDEYESTEKRENALNKLIEAYPEIIKKYIDENGQLKEKLRLLKEISEYEDNKAKQANIDDLTNIDRAIKAYQIYERSGAQKGLNTLSRAQRDEYEWAQKYTKGLGIDVVRMDLNNVITDLQKQRNIVGREVAKSKATAFLDSLNGDTTEEQLKAIVDNDKKLLTKLIKDTDVIYDEYTKDYLNKSDIQARITKIEGMQSARSKSGENFGKLYKDAEAQWRKDKATLDKINKNREKYTRKQYDDAVKAEKASNDTFKKLGGSTTDKTVKNAQKEADKQAKAQDKIDNELTKLLLDNQKESVALMKDGTQKELAQIKADFDAKETEIKNQISEVKKLNKEAGESNLNANGLTDEQQKSFDEATKLNAEKRADAEKMVYRSGLESMRDYLEQYGSFQDKKLAITQKYAQMIADVQNSADSEQDKEWQIKSLNKQRDTALAGIETQALKNNMNWEAVFGEFGNMFVGVIKPALDNAKKYMQTDEFKSSDIDLQKTLIDAVMQMESVVGDMGAVDFKKLGNDIATYQNAQKQLTTSTNVYNDRVKDLESAEEEHAEAIKSGNKTEIHSAELNLEIAKSGVNIAKANVEAAQKLSDEAQSQMTDTATALKAKMEGVLGGLQSIASGSLKGTYDGFISLGNALKGGTDIFSKSFSKISGALGKVPIVGEILGILDILKDGISAIITSIIDTLFSAITNILNDVLSGDLIMSMLGSLFDGITNVFESILNVGGLLDWADFSDWFGADGNSEKVQETINNLTKRNELLQTAIEDLTDEMSSSRGAKSVDVYNEAVKLQKETNANYKAIAQAQAGYHNSHHSWNYYWGGFNQEQINRLNSQLDRKTWWNGDIWDLSPDEMKKLRSNVDMWQQIINTGKGGYGQRLADKLNDYIAQAGKLDELTNQLYESLTGVSFDSMYDSFLDKLMDMKYSAKDAANDISEYFFKAMLSNKIGELLSDDLEDWWEAWGEAMEDGMSDEERENLLKQYQEIVDEAIQYRDEMAEATGYTGESTSTSTSEQASSKGFAAASQDSVEELSGRATAIQEGQIRQEVIAQQQNMSVLEINATLTAMAATTVAIHDIADENRDILNESLSTLIEIRDNINYSNNLLTKINKGIGEVKNKL